VSVEGLAAIPRVSPMNGKADDEYTIVNGWVLSAEDIRNRPGKR
jgi:hypothetical protein